MIPVDQTIFGMPLGDCHRACIASILELEITDVPNFNEAGEDWFMAMTDWLEGRGLGVIDAPADETTACALNGYWIASGPAARGVSHSCVYEGHELVHDPHPDRTGLLEIEHIEVIYQLDPARGG